MGTGPDSKDRRATHSFPQPHVDVLARFASAFLGPFFRGRGQTSQTSTISDPTCANGGAIRDRANFPASDPTSAPYFNAPQMRCALEYLLQMVGRILWHSVLQTTFTLRSISRMNPYKRRRQRICRVVGSKALGLCVGRYTRKAALE